MRRATDTWRWHRASRKGDRAIRRHGDLRRQGHGLSALEVRAARQGLPLSRVRSNDRAQPPLWSTTSLPSATSPNPPTFGRASWVCNVIDTRQSYLQKLLKQALAALGYEAQAGHSVHYAYEMVALSHATARELGYSIDADADRPFVEVSGRQGPRRQGRRPDRSPDRQGRERSGEAQSRPLAGPDAPHRRSDRRRRGALLHGEVLARQGHRLRHRRGAQLRRGKRAVPSVRRRAREQHLQQAQGSRRRRRGAACSPPSRPRRSTS